MNRGESRNIIADCHGSILSTLRTMVQDWRPVSTHSGHNRLMTAFDPKRTLRQPSRRQPMRHPIYQALRVS